MDLLDLKYLIILSEFRNFGRAAAELGVSTSTLSRRVARLENQLGVLIFERTRAGATPTLVGHELLKCARRALAEIDALKQVAKSNSSAQHGALRLATQISIIANQFKAWLVEWRALHPTIDLQLWEMNDREILTALNSRQVDVGIMFTPSVGSRVESLTLFTERLMLAVDDAHPLSARAAVSWDDMRHLRLLVRSWDGSQAYREIQASLIGSHAEFRPQHASYTTAP